ncbi:MAG: hypothetical protein Q9216_004874 [Gyalolechia sp. 2 TL-2023]
MDEPPLTSFSVTHVSYDASDPVAYLCAWLALVPQILSVVYVTLIWSSREVEVIIMFIGQMGCEALNFLLKRLIKGERPPRIKSKGYGMPSSHAQFVAFFSVYLTLFLLIRHSPHPSDTHKPTTYTQRVILSVWTFLFAASWGWIQWALDRREATALRIRDLVVEEDLAESGWERWRVVKKRRKTEMDRTAKPKKRRQ